MGEREHTRPYEITREHTRAQEGKQEQCKLARDIKRALATARGHKASADRVDKRKLRASYWSHTACHAASAGMRADDGASLRASPIPATLASFSSDLPAQLIQISFARPVSLPSSASSDALGLLMLPVPTDAATF